MTKAKVPNYRQQPIDRDALHRYLYRHADHFGRYKLHLRTLSEETDISYTWLSVIITAMTNEGRLHRIGGGDWGPKTFRVEDPAAWTSRQPKMA